MVTITELSGYVASFLVAISLLMSGILALRVLNLFGAIAFVVYGALLGSVPVLLANGFIVLVDVYYLVRMLRPDLNGVRYLSVGRDKRGQLDDFVSHHLDDILRYFPDFSTDRLTRCFDAGGSVFVALKDLTVVGFALVMPVPPAEAEPDAALREVYRRVHADLFPDRTQLIPVDYITRKYRGLGLVNSLYGAIEAEAPEGTEFFLAPVPRSATKHQKFLTRHGYQRAAETGAYLLYAKAVEGV